MNLFILSLCAEECAKYMFDKHIYKIILEAVQMLCTAKQMLEPEYENEIKLYKIAHKNHPVTIWVRKSLANYMWTLDLVEELHKEWRHRYQHPDTKFHRSYLMAQILRANVPSPDKFEAEGLTPFALAMPDKYKTADPVESYRNYYMSEDKQRFATWHKRRGQPSWYEFTIDFYIYI